MKSILFILTLSAGLASEAKTSLLHCTGTNGGYLTAEATQIPGGIRVTNVAVHQTDGAEQYFEKASVLYMVTDGRTIFSLTLQDEAKSRTIIHYDGRTIAGLASGTRIDGICRLQK